MQEVHRSVVSCLPPPGDLAHNPGMCPHWESNWQPLGSQAGTQSTEPHQPGLKFTVFNCTVQWHFICSQGFIALATLQFQNIFITQRKTQSCPAVTPHPLLPESLTFFLRQQNGLMECPPCLLYTSDAADDWLVV